MCVCVCVCVCVVSRIQLFAPWTGAFQFPLSVNFPGKNTGVGCHFLLQGIFSTQGSKPQLLCHLHWQTYSLPQHHLGGPEVL